MLGLLSDLELKLQHCQDASTVLRNLYVMMQSTLTTIVQGKVLLLSSSTEEETEALRV